MYGKAVREERDRVISQRLERKIKIIIGIPSDTVILFKLVGKNIFIGYSPIHIFSAFSLLEKKSLLIMPKKFLALIQK